MASETPSPTNQKIALDEATAKKRGRFIVVWTWVGIVLLGAVAVYLSGILSKKPWLCFLFTSSPDMRERIL